jgi:hypothetical protein
MTLASIPRGTLTTIRLICAVSLSDTVDIDNLLIMPDAKIDISIIGIRVLTSITQP